ncbi:MAG: hypothetical protein WCB68_02250, partial [Pyrinomonadaceae bacterium]
MHDEFESPSIEINLSGEFTGRKSYYETDDRRRKAEEKVMTACSKNRTVGKRRVERGQARLPDCAM